MPRDRIRQGCLPDTRTNKAHPEYGTYGKDLGISTYPRRLEDRRRRVLGFFSYDPELKLVYSSTGTPVCGAHRYRCGDKTHRGMQHRQVGQQMVADHLRTQGRWRGRLGLSDDALDQWDYDGVNENMLTDIDIDGKKVKALTHFDRNGFAYVLDRTDGTLLRANKYVTVDWAEKIDLKTGRPIKVPEHSPLEVGRNVNVCPSAMGGKDQQPCAVDPKEPNIFSAH